MSPQSLNRQARTSLPKTPKDRRLGPEAGPLPHLCRWLQGLLRRPIGIVGERGQRRLGFVERRKRPADALAVAGLRADLRQRLLALSPERAERHFSQLVQVHDELGHKGWAGVALLPHSVLARALAQADELRREAPSPTMKQLVDKLRSLQPPPPPAPPAVDLNATDAREPRRPPGASLEVSEATPEDFEASKRSWFAELPPEPEAPEAHK